MQLARRVIGIAGVALLVLGLVAGGLGVWLAQATHRFAADAERTAGRVMGHRETAQREAGPLYTPRIAFTAVDGTRHEFSGQLSASAPRLATGTTVPVIYRRSDPLSARVDLFLDNWLGASAAFLLALASTLAGLVLRRSTPG